MKRTLFLICTALAAGGCKGSSESDSSSTSNPSTVTLANRPAENRPAENRPAENRPAAGPPTLNVPAAAPDERAADTMSMDESDRSGAPSSAGDPGTAEADRRITQEIHQALLEDTSLPATAKDVKVSMKDGVVTLQGPVNSRQEKSQIAAVVQRVSGITRIDNRLDIVSVSP